MSYEVKQAICQTLLNMLLLGLGAFLLFSAKEVLGEVKEAFRELAAFAKK